MTNELKYNLAESIFYKIVEHKLYPYFIMGFVGVIFLVGVST